MRLNGRNTTITNKTREYLPRVLEHMRIRAYSLRARKSMKNPVLTQAQVDEFLRSSTKAEEVPASK